MTFNHPGPLVDLIGIKKGHATRAIKYLRDRSILAFYDAPTKTLRAPVLKGGIETTDEALRNAYKATL